MHLSPGPFWIEAKTHLNTKGCGCTATDASLTVHEESGSRRHLANSNVVQDGFTYLDGWRAWTIVKNVVEQEETVLWTGYLKV